MRPLRKSLLLYVTTAVLLVVVYSFVFLVLMASIEGRSYTAVDAVYWVVATMTTQGVGDIVFVSNVGRIFTMLVELSGIVLFFAILIPVVVAPVLQSVQSSVPTKSNAKEHVVIAGYSSMVDTIIEELHERDLPYLIVDEDRDVVQALVERKIPCIYGDPSDETTLRNAQIQRAKKVVLNQSDEKNAIIALVAHKLTRADIIGLVDDLGNAVYLLYAGADKVVSPKQLLGIDIGHKAAMPITHRLIGTTPLIGSLRIFELPILGESGLDGSSIEEAKIRERTGATVIGLWKGAKLIFNPSASEVITDSTVLLLVGTKKQLNAAKELSICRLDGTYCAIRGHYIVAGYGDVGKRASKVLRSNGIEHVIIDKHQGDVVGNSTDRAVLKQAGITEASSLVVTVNSDLDAIYTTLVARKLNPQIDIICRAMRPQAVEKLYQAGADYVLSQSVVAGQVLVKFVAPSPLGTQLREILLSEDMKILEYPLGPSLAGSTLRDLKIRSRTGCTVVAITANGATTPNPDPQQVIPANSFLTVIGTREQIREFKRVFG
ncbi:MAG TPA: NAD-binding protein [Candidatus Bathyarchaeia archaeon]|nr:NAD-binding protein [Candidatus Bathyarchaeia archaeon]